MSQRPKNINLSKLHAETLFNGVMEEIVIGALIGDYNIPFKSVLLTVLSLDVL